MNNTHIEEHIKFIKFAHYSTSSLFICIIRYMPSAMFNFIHRIQNVEHGFRAISRVEISTIGVSHTNLMWLHCLTTLDFLLTLLIVKPRKF